MASDLCRLVDARELRFVCDDCGRQRRWAGGRIAHESARFQVFSVEQLGSRLRCSYCQDYGSPGRNITIYPTWRSDPQLNPKGA